MQRHRFGMVMVTLLLAPVFAACDARQMSSPASPATPALGLTAPGAPSRGVPSLSVSADAGGALAELRRLFAPFHNMEQAQAAGYSVPLPGPGVCISDPVRGGMGYHFARGDKDLIGDGVVNLFEPEFVVYSPTDNGGQKFSALDYFVPYATWPNPQPPSLLGIPFHREDAFQAYVLHIWLFWHNPAGMFENFNPEVPQCPA